MRRFYQTSFFCLVTVLAISLSAFSGCDLGTYSERSTEFLEANPDGMRKEMKKEKMEMKEEKMDMKDGEKTSAAAKS